MATAEWLQQSGYYRLLPATTGYYRLHQYLGECFEWHDLFRVPLGGERGELVGGEVFRHLRGEREGRV